MSVDWDTDWTLGDVTSVLMRSWNIGDEWRWEATGIGDDEERIVVQSATASTKKDADAAAQEAANRILDQQRQRSAVKTVTL